MVAFSSLLQIFGRTFDDSRPHLCYLFFKWRSTHTHQFHFLGQDQSTVAQVHVLHYDKHNTIRPLKDHPKYKKRSSIVFGKFLYLFFFFSLLHHIENIASENSLQKEEKSVLKFYFLNMLTLWVLSQKSGFQNRDAVFGDLFLVWKYRW